MTWRQSVALGERVAWAELDSGLRVYVMPRPGWRRRSALLTVDFGALDRELIHAAGTVEPLPAGVAHFLEHRLFEKAGGDLTERFAQLGAEVDADTTFTHTDFGFTCRDHFGPCLDLLFELALTVVLDPASVARERDIIQHEIQLTADALDWVGYFRALGTVFAGQPLTEDIAGSSPSLARIDAELLARCHRHLYRGERLCLYVCGDVEPADVFRQAAAAVERHGGTDGAGGRLRRPVLLPVCGRRDVSTLPISRPHVTLAFGDRRAGLAGVDLLQRELALELALHMLLGPSSQAYAEWYDAGHIDGDSFGFEVNCEPTFGVCLVAGESSEPEHLEDLVRGCLEQARRRGMSRRDFDLARRKAYGDLVRAYESVDGCVQAMHSAVSCGAEPFAFLMAYERVGLDDVEECLASCLDPVRCGVSVVMPGPDADPAMSPEDPGGLADGA